MNVSDLNTTGPRRRDGRHGLTLFEVVLSMSVAIVLLGINVSWLHQSLSFAATTKIRQRTHHSLLRLASDLRDDVRSSQIISIDDEQRLVLTMNSNISKSEVRYTLAGDRVLVEKRTNHEVLFHDAYILSDKLNLRWVTTEMPDYVTLVVSKKRPELPSAQVEPPSQEGRQDQAEAKTPASSTSMPVVLHVRSGPNRWSLTSGSGKSNSENEVPK